MAAGRSFRACAMTYRATRSTTCAGSWVLTKGSVNGEVVTMVAYPALFMPEDDGGSASSSGICRRRTRSATIWRGRSRLPCTAWTWRSSSDQGRRALAGALIGRAGRAADRAAGADPCQARSDAAHARDRRQQGRARPPLGVSEGAVRRLLRFDHRSHIDRIEAAIKSAGAAPRPRRLSGGR